MQCASHSYNIRFYDDDDVALLKTQTFTICTEMIHWIIQAIF